MTDSTDQNLLAYIRVLLRWRWFIILTVGLTTVGATIVSLMLPKWYRSEALLLVPEKPFGFGITPNMEGLSDLSIPGFSLNRRNQDTRRILAILNSRTMMESVIGKFGLQQTYDRETMEETIKELQENVDVAVEDEGTISVAALDRTPSQAAAMVDYIVAELERRNVELQTSDARSIREFIESQYDKNQQELKDVEEQYRAFTKEHHVIALPEQTEAAITTIAELQGEKVRTEIQLKVLERMLGAEHPEVRRLRVQEEEQQQRLKEMIFKGEQIMGNAARGEDARLFVPLQEISDVGLAMMRLERDLRIQNELHGLLTQFYEQAKIQEAKDTPTIQVLDPAVVPERKYKPKRSLIVLAFVAASLFVSVGTAFTVEYLRRIRSAL